VPAHYDNFIDFTNQAQVGRRVADGAADCLAYASIRIGGQARQRAVAGKRIWASGLLIGAVLAWLNFRWFAGAGWMGWWPAFGCAGWCGRKPRRARWGAYFAAVFPPTPP